MLSFDAARCVRSRAVAATCRACVDACPTQALSVVGVDLHLQAEACVDCGVCAGVCPTDAFPPPPAPPGPLLRCGEGVPCVAALSTERLVVLAERGLIVLVGARDCPARAAHDRVAERVARVLALSGRELAWHEEETATAAEAPEEGATAPLIDRRSLTPAALRARLTRPGRDETLAVLRERARVVDATTADFTSSKVLDTALCTGCQRCVSMCPTGALTSSLHRDELRFDASTCVACGLCHDVCEPGALTRGPQVDLARLGERVVLGRLRMRPCGECGVWFKADDDDAACPRCAAMDDEARALLGWSS